MVKTKLQSVSEKLDKVSIALLMLINMLREQREIAGEKIMAAVPDELLDSIEAMLTK